MGEKQKYAVSITVYTVWATLRIFVLYVSHVRQAHIIMPTSRRKQLKLGTGGLTMAEPKKPFYRNKKWKLGRSFGWWHIPYCPHCKRQLGLMAEEQKAEKCPMCGKPLEWDDTDNG